MNCEWICLVPLFFSSKRQKIVGNRMKTGRVVASCALTWRKRNRTIKLIEKMKQNVWCTLIHGDYHETNGIQLRQMLLYHCFEIRTCCPPSQPILCDWKCWKDTSISTIAPVRASKWAIKEFNDGFSTVSTQMFYGVMILLNTFVCSRMNGVTIKERTRKMQKTVVNLRTQNVSYDFTNVLVVTVSENIF